MGSEKQVDVLALGGIAVDLIVLVQGFPRIGGETRITSYQKCAGGSGANFAVAVSRLGLRSGFIGKVGDDDHGSFLLQEFKKEGVDTSLVTVERGLETSIVISLIDERGERTMLSYPGANTQLSPEDVDFSRLSRSRLLQVSGYSFIHDPQKSTTLEAMRTARESGVLVSLDPSPLIGRVDPKVVKEALKLTNIIFPNMAEARALTGRQHTKSMVTRLLEMGPMIVALKLGWRGCLVGKEGQHILSPGFKVKVVDTTGAGDAFDAGFVVGYLEGWDLTKVAKFANAVGAISTTKVGAREGLPFFGEVEDFLSTG